MEVLDDFLDIEDLTKEEEEIIEVHCIIFPESTRIFLVDVEDDGSEIAIDRSSVFIR